MAVVLSATTQRVMASAGGGGDTPVPSRYGDTGGCGQPLDAAGKTWVASARTDTSLASPTMSGDRDPPPPQPVDECVDPRSDQRK